MSKVRTITNETNSLVKDIVYNKDVDGVLHTILVCKLTCNIVANTSISYTMRVLDLEIYNENKDIIQEEIDAFKIQAQNLAKTYNVPII